METNRSVIVISNDLKFTYLNNNRDGFEKHVVIYIKKFQLNLFISPNRDRASGCRIDTLAEYEPHDEKNCRWGFRPGPTNRAVQPKKMDRGLKFRI